MKARASVLRAFEGVCIARADGLNENFTVRKISYGEGVEQVFPIYSPLVDSIELVRRGRVRRAKLYYLRVFAARLPDAEKRVRSEKTKAEAVTTVPITAEEGTANAEA